MDMEQVQPYNFITQNIRNFVNDLSSFVRIPSISADSKYSKHVRNCATWLVAHLTQIGLENVQVYATAKHPIIYADWMHASDKPTLLIYGHYDVQPVDPVSEWRYPPFSGMVKDGFIYGRGSSDDKGQLFAHIKALEFFLKSSGRLPINIKCIFEGEEEIGSPGLQELIMRNPAICKANLAVVSDMSIPSASQPAITNSLRGALSFELEISGQRSDLHSGTFGGAIHNPSHVLCKIISGLHDDKGAITIPGFYDQVQTMSSRVRSYMKLVNRSDEEILRDAGTLCGNGETGYSLYENIVTRPSISINGLNSGYQGEGPKAIIPAKASAKLGFRLVYRQDPNHIEKIFRNYLQTKIPRCFHVTLRKQVSAHPVFIDASHIYIQAASRAYQKVFRKKIIFQGSGGTIPVVNLFYNVLKMPVILMGFALPDDSPHGPNEKFSIAAFIKGIGTSIQFMIELGKINHQRLK